MNGSNDHHISQDDDEVLRTTYRQNNFNVIIYESPLVVNNPEDVLGAHHYEGKGGPFMQWNNNNDVCLSNRDQCGILITEDNDYVDRRELHQIIIQHDSHQAPAKERLSVEHVNQTSTTEVAQLRDQIKVTWKNVKYEVEVKTPREKPWKIRKKGVNKYERREILKEQSGQANPKETLFIMGASGCGKTSLLNLISDRIAKRKHSKIEGDIKVNDTVELNYESFSKIGAYVMQDDHLFSFFTPREALTFACRLKLHYTTKTEQDKRVKQLLDDLAIPEKIADTKIGNILQKTISGGERKRTSIGVEMITDPLILLLDEPTSGLDSFNAHRIVKLLHDFARKKGKTIISTIHQPSSKAFGLFDQLILMVDGYTIYSGRAKDAITYINQLGFPSPKYANPADFMIKLLQVEYPKTPDEENRIKFFVEKYNEQKKSERLQVSSNDFEGNNATQKEIQRLHQKYKTRKLFCLQLKQLMKRDYYALTRDPRQLRVRMIRSIIVGLLIIAVFWKLNGTSKSDIMGMSGALFFVCTNLVFMHLQSSILIFQLERPIFLREQSEGMYGILPYYLSKIFVDLPILIVTVIVFVIIIYFGIGLVNNAWSFFKFLFTVILVGFLSQLYGLTLSVFFNQPEAAVGIAPIFMLPLMILGGFMTNSGTVPAWFGWLQYISPVRYGFEALQQNEFSGRPNLEFNILGFLSFSLGYGLCMIFMLILCTILMFISVIVLKLKVTRYQ